MNTCNADERCRDGMWWWMCYHYVIGEGQGQGFGCTKWSGLETPWQKLIRWNEQHEERTYVLVNFGLVNSHEPAEFDMEHSWWHPAT